MAASGPLGSDNGYVCSPLCILKDPHSIADKRLGQQHLEVVRDGFLPCLFISDGPLVLLIATKRRGSAECDTACGLNMKIIYTEVILYADVSMVPSGDENRSARIIPPGLLRSRNE
ncbi:hypothetical protein [Lonsdalea quercina]|uniref:hypothetical protein n=1 Tax=Lonsdalea quercina TaxID=71657 RepID=UPI003976C711